MDSDRRRLAFTEQEMRDAMEKVSEMIIGHFLDLPRKSIGRFESPGGLEDRLDLSIPERGQDCLALLDSVDNEIFTDIMHLDHPRFFGFIPGPSNFAGVLAEVLAAGYNVFNATWLEGSSAAAVEETLIDWLCEKVGYPGHAGGHFVSGGSVANLTALCVAREIKLGECFQSGTVYFSDQTHHSVHKALKILGIPADNLRIIPSRKSCTLDIDQLRCLLQADRRDGVNPFLVVANAGTTNTGSVDPLEAIADICDTEDLWLHVDGAYGVPSVLTAKGKKLMKGLHKADSIAVDPHKWLFQPYELGCVLVKDSQVLPDTFQILPEYMQDIAGNEKVTNFCDYGIQLSRDFKAFKLWLTLKVFGERSVSRAVQHGLDLACYTSDIIREEERLELICEPQLGIVCFRYRGEGGIDNCHLQTQIADRLTGDGHALISTTVIEGKKVLRICTINPRTTMADIQSTLDTILDIGEVLV